MATLAEHTQKDKDVIYNEIIYIAVTSPECSLMVNG